jgi:hypothetical protein
LGKLWHSIKHFFFEFTAEEDFTDPMPQVGLLTKATYAKQMLDNPIYKEVLQKIEADAVKLWQNSPLHDVEQREIMYMQHRVLKQIDAYIKRYVVDAQYEAHQEQMKDHQAEKAMV